MRPNLLKIGLDLGPRFIPRIVGVWGHVGEESPDGHEDFACGREGFEGPLCGRGSELICQPDQGHVVTEVLLYLEEVCLICI